MSDSENYFSDTDKSEGNEETSDTFLEQEQYEMDEETRRIIYESFRKKENTKSEVVEHIPTKKKRERKVKEKKTISLLDLEEKEELSKQKKWSGKRFSNKKKEMGIEHVKVKKRQFNPRLPIPSQETFRKIDIIDDINFSPESFPELEV